MGKLGLLAIALIIFLFGILLIFFSHFILDYGIWQHLLRDLGIALIIAGAIAATIEKYLKQELYSEIRFTLDEFTKKSINAAFIKKELPVSFLNNINDSITKYHIIAKI